MNPNTAINVPQCNPIDLVGGDTLSICGSIDNLKLSGEDEGACLQSLPDDVLLNVLLYCGPTDVEESLKLVNRRFQ